MKSSKGRFDPKFVTTWYFNGVVVKSKENDTLAVITTNGIMITDPLPQSTRMNPAMLLSE